MPEFHRNISLRNIAAATPEIHSISFAVFALLILLSLFLLMRLHAGLHAGTWPHAVSFDVDRGDSSRKKIMLSLITNIYVRTQEEPH